MKIYLADFETSAFDYSKKENYFLEARFLCLKEINSGKKIFFDLENKSDKDLRDFLFKLCSLNNPSRIYFHNLKFDLAFLYPLLPKNYNYEIIKNNKVIALKIYRAYKRIEKNGKERIQRKTLLEIRDTTTLLPTSIEKIGLSLGFPKLKQDYFSKTITKEYINYCFRDIEILEKALNNLIKIYKKHFNYQLKIIDLPLTVSSLSKRLFNKLTIDKFGMKIFRQLYHKSAQEIEKELRPYYVGGRVEVYDFNRKNSGHYNDFNSWFPFNMVANKFPIPPYTSYNCIDSEQCFSEWKNNPKIFGCLCEINENQDIPIVPTRLEIKKGVNKIIFANGKKTFFLFRPEIEHLLKLKQKIVIKKIYLCSMYLDIFSEYINSWYKLKQISNPESFEYLFSKICMNGLYGKFAEKREKDELIIINNLKEYKQELENDEFLNNLEFTESGYILKREKVHESLKINIIFSMMITALARLGLQKNIVKVNDSTYCDTDSIVSESLIEHSLELGKMKSEFQFKSFQALGCKEYVVIDDKDKLIIKMKGFGFNEKKMKEIDKNTPIEYRQTILENFNNFVAKYKEGKYQNRMIGFMESFNRKLPLTTMIVFNKYKQNVYDKRWILPNLKTKPFNLETDNYNNMIKNNEFYINQIISNYKNIINTTPK